MTINTGRIRKDRVNILKDKLRSHTWSIIGHVTGDRVMYEILCNGEPFPIIDEYHSIVFRKEPGAWLTEDENPPVRAMYTSFTEDLDLQLVKMRPVIFEGKRLSAPLWLSTLKPGTRYYLKEHFHGRDVPEWVEAMWPGARYVHGLTEQTVWECLEPEYWLDRKGL